MRRFALFALLFTLSACAGERVPSRPDPASGASGPAPPATPADPDTFPGPQSTSDAQTRLGRAEPATTAAGSARTTFLATLTDLPGRPGPVSLTGTGEADFATGRMRSIIDLSGAFERPTSVGVDPSWETVSADGLVYLRAPILAELFEIETPWVRIDASSELLDATGLQGLAGSDSGAPLALLAGVDEGSVLDLGPSEIEGTPTSHLRATVDLVAAVDALRVDGPDEAHAALERFVESLGARQLTLDAFLDGDDRVRRLVYEHQLPPDAGGGSQRVELEYLDFGIPIDVAPPPPHLVSELSDALGPR